MTDKLHNQETPPEIGHTVGEHNIEVLGLDIHNPVFAVSAVVAIVIVVGTLLFQEAAAVLFADMRNWITSSFDWRTSLTGLEHTAGTASR